MGDVHHHVLVRAIAAHEHPIWEPVADAYGNGGLTFERACKRYRSKGAPAGDRGGRHEVLPDSRSLDPGLAVGAPTAAGVVTVLVVVSAPGDAAGVDVIGLTLVVGGNAFSGVLVAWVQAVTLRLRTVRARKVWVRRALERFMTVPSVRRGSPGGSSQTHLCPARQRAEATQGAVFSHLG
jgi:hypothetical protein